MTKGKYQSKPGSDIWIALGLFMLTLLSRVPFRSQILYHWDSVNFAYAMREFSVAKEQPQPPGYIVYVWLCRLVDLLLSDAQATMVWISIIASALAVTSLFYLGRSMFNLRVGVIAALFLAVSPLFWFYGEIALPHTLDAMLMIVSAWWLYETMRGHQRYLYPAIAVLAIAGGVRQQTIVFLAPLLLFALRHVGWKRFLTAGALGAVICLIWFIPLITSSGGVSEYMQIMGEYTQRFQNTTSIFRGGGWWGIKRNLIKLTLYSLYAWSIVLVPWAIYTTTRLWKHKWPSRWDKLIFLFLWTAPALIFYTIVHMGQQGLVFVFLPALLLTSTVGLERLLSHQRHWLLATTGIIITLNVGIFCFVPEYPLGPDTQRLLTHATLKKSDHYYQDRFQAIENNFAPDSTAILAANWHHVEYYLPAYQVIPFDIIAKWEKGAGQPRRQDDEVQLLDANALDLTPVHNGQVNVVIFDPLLERFNETTTCTQELSLKHNRSLSYFTLDKSKLLRYSTQSFGLISP